MGVSYEGVFTETSESHAPRAVRACPLGGSRASTATGRRPALACPPRGLHSPARLAVCSARALPVWQEDICKFKLVGTPDDYSDAISTGVLQAERQAEALRSVYEQDNRCLQVVKGKRPGDLLKLQTPCIQAGVSRIGKLRF